MRSTDHRASSLLALLLCLLALPLNAATATGSAVPLAPPDPAIKHRLLLADQGACRLMLVDQNDPTKDWTVQLPPKDYGHDLQVIGNDQVLVSVPNGWQERSLKDGSLVKDQPHVAVGSGKINVPAVVAAANGRVTRALIVELDACGTDMLTAVRQSRDYLVAKGLAIARPALG